MRMGVKLSVGNTVGPAQWAQTEKDLCWCLEARESPSSLGEPGSGCVEWVSAKRWEVDGASSSPGKTHNTTK